MYPIDNFIPILAATIAPGGEAVSGTIGGLVFFITVALGVSFLCSILEASILSVPSSYSETQAETGSRAGRLMQKHKQNVEGPITAILTLNTIAHTVGAAGAGAEAVGVFGSQWFGVISAVLTLLILIFSEIIPKTLGAVYWKPLFAFTAYATQALIILTFPAVWMFRAITNIITPDHKEPTISRIELVMMAKISATEGTLNEKEGLILRNLLHLNAVHVGDIMTPRTVVEAFLQGMTVGEVIGGKRVIPYSRIPIYDSNIDSITGFVLRYDILKAVANDEHDKKLHEFKRPMHTIPETLTVASVLNEFVQRQEHIFLVIDEYGGTAGIITLEDAIESLLGAEITDESDLVADMRQLAEQRYTRQKTLLEDAARTFGEASRSIPQNPAPDSGQS